MGKLIPLILILVGLGGGVGAGIALRPVPDEESHTPEVAKVEPDYVKLSNQFVVPVVEKGHVASLVIMSLSLAVDSGGSEPVFAREPRLRDAFLQVLFDHANTGGFRGSFTDADNLIVLRRSLLEVAKKVLPAISDVLIVDIMRQDS